MRRTGVIVGLLLGVAGSALPAGVGSRGTAHTLTFEQRVEAQAAVERVYYAHRTGAKRPFEQAVPRDLIERKVRLQVAESAALEKLWNSPITAEALRREMERIAAHTRAPQQLEEIYASLGRDPFLIQETFVRASLADRLARSFVGAAQWDEWSAAADHDFNQAVVEEVADPSAALPSPGASLSGAPEAASCDLLDVWGAGGNIDPPEGRSDHTAVWTGSEMIVWGGSGSGTSLRTGSRYDPLTDTWRSTSLAGAPSGRSSHTAVWTGNEMIVWGGSGGLTTGGRYDPVSDTWAPTSMTGVPEPRNDHNAVWSGSVMIVWGGRSSTPLNTGGRYDPVTDTWSTTSLVNAPAGRYGHVAVWSGTEMIMWGGRGTTTGGRYNPATDTWSATSTLNAPSAREIPSAVWTGTEMIVWGGFFGGYAPGGGRYNPLTDTWRATTMTNAPANRYYHSAFWTGSRMIIWGGIDFSHGAPNPPVNDGARYDPVGDAWSSISSTGVPSPRGHHAGVWTGSLMIVWGGGGLNDGGRYDPLSNSWTPTSVASLSPSQRRAHTAIWTGTEMIIWGGDPATQTGGRYDPLLDSWSPTPLAGAPSARSEHTAVWSGSEMIVWGGKDASDAPLASGGRYDPSSDAWSTTSPINAPSARTAHTAVWTGTQMIVWGGEAGGLLATGGRYDPVTDTWSATTPAGAPAARSSHTAVWTGQRMIVWGGSGAGSLATGGLYDPAGDAWAPVAAAGAPSGRFWHTAVWTGQKMIIWGGYGAGSLATGGLYDPAGDVWAPVATSGAPSGRFSHTAVWTGREMIVWGGAYTWDFYISSTNTGGRYDPAAGTWTPTTTLNAPEARDLHTAVWTGGVMIVRGGERNTGDVVYMATDPQASWYGAASASPSPDGDLDGFSVCGGDCDDANPAVYPGAPQVCGDGLNNDCAHPFWPSLAGTNEADNDGDGRSECAGDCDDGDSSVWGTPSEVADLSLAGGPTAALAWTPPADPGAVKAAYDTLRSPVAGDFTGPALCVESGDSSDTAAVDPDSPPPGGVYYYLVRAVDACPAPLGTGSLGVRSDGTPRAGRACP